MRWRPSDGDQAIANGVVSLQNTQGMVNPNNNGGGTTEHLRHRAVSTTSLPSLAFRQALSSTGPTRRSERGELPDG